MATNFTDSPSNGNTIVVGAPLNSSKSAPTRSGAIYVYNRMNNLWAETQILHPTLPFEDAQFGKQTRISGDGKDIFSSTKLKLGHQQGEQFTLSHDTWAFKNTFPLPSHSSIIGMDLSQDGKTISYTTIYDIGVTKYIDNEWGTEQFVSPRQDIYTGRAELNEDGNILIVTERDDISEPSAGISIFQYINNEWVYDQTLYVNSVIWNMAPEKAKINEAGDTIYAIEALFGGSFTYAEEGVYSIDTFSATHYLPGQVDGLASSMLIHVFRKQNSQWNEVSIIHNRATKQLYPYNPTGLLLAEGHLYTMDIIESSEGVAQDIIKFY